MRFAIDARPAIHPRRTGVGRYALGLIHHLPSACAPDRVAAWYLDPGGLLSRRRWFAAIEPEVEEHAGRLQRHAFGAISRLGVPRLEWTVPFDALLATNFLPPPTRSRAVVLVVHDLAYEVLPDTSHHDHRWRRRFDEWLRLAAGVIVPSRSTKDDLLARHELDVAKVWVVPHGVEPVPAPDRSEIRRVRERFGIGGPYALFVGMIEPRKNLPALVAAFTELEQDEAWLVIAGGRARWNPRAADDLRERVAALPEPIRRRVVLTGYAGDAEREALLAGASVLAYPSRYEGFGFPVLEAFAAGVPVLTSSTSSLPEVAGDAAVLVDPHDVHAIAGGLRSLFENAGLRERLVAAGTARVRTFTWQATAAATAEVLRAAARSAGARPGSTRGH